MNEPEVLYTAEATVTGGSRRSWPNKRRPAGGRLRRAERAGRPGRARRPTPAALLTGYAACFQSSLLRFAGGRNLDLSGTRITARVGIGPLKSGGLGLVAALDLDVDTRLRAEAFN